MDSKRKNRYLDKIDSLRKYYQLLIEWFKDSDFDEINEYGNFKEIFAIYHAAQLSIEVISDLCAMIVKDLVQNPKDDYSNFEKLYTSKIITKDLFKALKELNGLRNRIVHDYNGLIDEIAWKSISENVQYI
ncbi:MAG: type VII toxin-antitoxin system HepT family RNase toxin, partial [Candidatus Helarchaeota archaeon]